MRHPHNESVATLKRLTRLDSSSLLTALKLCVGLKFSSCDILVWKSCSSWLLALKRSSRFWWSSSWKRSYTSRLNSSFYTQQSPQHGVCPVSLCPPQTRGKPDETHLCLQLRELSFQDFQLRLNPFLLDLLLRLGLVHGLLELLGRDEATVI